MKNKDFNKASTSNSNNFLLQEYYAKMVYWTKEEAIMILATSSDTPFSEASRLLNMIKKLKENGHVIPNLHLLERAMEHHELPTKEQQDPNSSRFVMVFRPIDFIKWTKKKEIALPNRLEELIKKYHVDVDLEAKYKKLEAENQELKEIISKREEEKPAHGNSVFTYQRIIFLLIKEAYATGNLEIKPEDFKKFTAEFIANVDLLRDDQNIKLPFSMIPDSKTFTSTFQDIVNKLYKNNKHPKIKHVK